MTLLVKVLFYIAVGAITGGFVGSNMPSLLWTLLATAATIVLLLAYFRRINYGKPADPDRFGFMIVVFLTIVSSIASLWIGYLFF